MQFFKETTDWSADVVNHVYLLDGDMMYGYSKFGNSELTVFKNPIRIDKRGRKFVAVANTYGFELKPPAGVETYKVEGSKGNTYTVTKDGGKLRCTCTGFTFRHTCKHLSMIK